MYENFTVFNNKSIYKFKTDNYKSLIVNSPHNPKIIQYIEKHKYTN